MLTYTAPSMERLLVRQAVRKQISAFGGEAAGNVAVR
jgi:hypothetical protein